MSAANLLAAARQMLRRGATPDDPSAGTWPRAVAVLTRQALEESLTDLWRRNDLDMERASARAQLLCLGEYIAEPDVVADAHYAWWALSRACHHHPYELAPTSGELESWIRNVESLAKAIETSGVNASATE